MGACCCRGDFVANRCLRCKGRFTTFVCEGSRLISSSDVYAWAARIDELVCIRVDITTVERTAAGG